MYAAISCYLSLAVKMERMLVLVFLILAMFNAGASTEDSKTTLGDIYFEETQETITEFSFHAFSYFNHILNERMKLNVTDSVMMPVKMEILEYVINMILVMLEEICSDLGSIPVKSIYEDLNHHCADYLESPIVNLTAELSNVTCVYIWLQQKIVTKLNIQAGLQRFSRDCNQQRVTLCQEVHAKCTKAYEEKVANLVNSYIVEKFGKLEQLEGPTPLMIIQQFVVYIVGSVIIPYSIANTYLKDIELLASSDSSVESQEQLARGIFASNKNNIDVACSSYRDIYSEDSEEHLKFLSLCYAASLYKSHSDLFNCVNSDRTTSNSLTWSTVPSAYFHSHCLCLAYSGLNCGVSAPLGVDPGLYCLSVLLRDFQRQVSYRPAVTYLDYAFKTPLPVCQFTNLVLVAFNMDCQDSGARANFNLLSVQCYFEGLLNTTNNCSETQLVNTYNQTELCVLLAFMQKVICEGDGDVEDPYYMTGDSPLVLFLTYGDVVVRVLTVITYLVCPQLRNLLGKLIIGYLITTLLRLIVVRAILADMALAVRFDVVTDLASTLWLTAFLHFLKVSIRDLRRPDSLSPNEARMVLLRCSLFGWVLPTALSVAFFSIDATIDSHVQIGQLLLLLSNFVALFCNLYIFFRICSLYYTLKSKDCEINLGGRKGTVFAKLFKFAIKTSVLSGAAIILRLIFLQIQGLEHFLAYCQALGTLQGLLVFFFYGCNREARAFWLQVFRSIHSRFSRGQNAPV